MRNDFNIAQIFEYKRLLSAEVLAELRSSGRGIDTLEQAIAFQAETYLTTFDIDSWLHSLENPPTLGEVLNWTENLQNFVWAMDLAHPTLDLRLVSSEDGSLVFVEVCTFEYEPVPVLRAVASGDDKLPF